MLQETLGPLSFLAIASLLAPQDGGTPPAAVPATVESRRDSAAVEAVRRARAHTVAPESSGLRGLRARFTLRVGDGRPTPDRSIEGSLSWSAPGPVRASVPEEHSLAKDARRALEDHLRRALVGNVIEEILHDDDGVRLAADGSVEITPCDANAWQAPMREQGWTRVDSITARFDASGNLGRVEVRGTASRELTSLVQPLQTLVLHWSDRGGRVVLASVETTTGLYVLTQRLRYAEVGDVLVPVGIERDLHPTEASRGLLGSATTRREELRLHEPVVNGENEGSGLPEAATTKPAGSDRPL